jgi:hypothetical protein
MAGIIRTISQVGNTLYALIFNDVGDVWDVGGAAFVTYDNLNWGDYDTALVELTSSGFYKATFPAAIAAGKYTVAIYQQLGGSPATGDPVIGAANFIWNGTVEEAGAFSALSDIDLDKLAAVTASAAPPVLGSWLDIIMSKNSSQTFDQSTDSLEALRDSAGGGPTVGQIADAVWDEVLDGSHAVADSGGQKVKDIHGKLPSGAISGFNPATTNVNLNTNQASVTVGTVNSLGSTARSQVNAEMVDVIFTDVMTELAAGTPVSAPTVAAGLMFIYMMARNKRTASNSQEKVYNAAGTNIATASVSDDGSVLTKDAFTAP